MKGEVGCGRSDMKRLKRRGERMAPCGTPFGSGMIFDLWFRWEIWADLPDMKLASHFLSWFVISVLSIFWMSRCLGTESKALLMSMAARTVLDGGEFWLKPSSMC